MSEIKCLDKGFVRLVDHMGDDAAIVQAARVSYGAGTKTLREDEALIRYLLRHKHTSPFEMVEFKLHCKMPIFIARQWIRHRTASVNEYSGRYSEMHDEFYVPKSEDIRTQDSVNKQGSSFSIDPEVAAQILHQMKCDTTNSFEHYQQYLSKGVSKEISRINLPLSIFTEWYWKIDLHNLLHFLRLRLDSHAQYEIRVYGQAIYDLIKPIVPATCRAFEDYVLNAVTFSNLELKALKNYFLNNGIELENLLREFYAKGSEAKEFENKIKTLYEVE